MRLLADENFPPALVSYLQKKHHDVKRIQRTHSGISDSTVLLKAVKENRVIFTFDADFLNQNVVKNKICIVLFKFSDLKPTQIIPYLDKIMGIVIELKNTKKYFIGSYSRDGWKLERK